VGKIREETLEVIFSCAAQIAREHNFDKLLDLIAHMGSQLISCDRCSIWLLDNQNGEIWTKVAQGVDRIRMPRRQGIVGEAVHEAKTIIINSPYDDPRFNRTIDTQTGYMTQSILVIPMFGINGDVIGAFQAINKLGDYAGFDDDDVKYLQLAATFSAKILNAEYLLHAANTMREEQMSAAVKQQSIIINEFAGDPHYEIITFSQACDILSGDTYALYKTKNDDVLIYCVDGMGHGILPSLTSFSVASTVKQFIHKVDSLQDLAVALLNNLRSVLGDEEQLSCAFLWLSKDLRAIDYFVSGFYPPLAQDDKGVIEIKANNLPLMNYTESIKVDRLERARFKKLLIYTDGLIEGQLFGFGRDMVETLLDPSEFQAMCDKIGGTQMDDDVTILYFGLK
jgi:putative methionine-R-sulfoxide reductase with GAF domain